MMDGMGGMMWAAGILWLLLVIVLVLAAAAARQVPAIRRDEMTPSPMAACRAAAKRSSRLKAGMTASVIVGIFGGMALVAAPLAAARAAASAWVGDEHAAARLVTAVEATGSGHTVDAGLEIRMARPHRLFWLLTGRLHGSRARRRQS